MRFMIEIFTWACIFKIISLILKFRFRGSETLIFGEEVVQEAKRGKIDNKTLAFELVQTQINFKLIVK